MTTERGPMEQVEPYPLNADGSLPKWFTKDGVWDPNKFDAGELYVPKGEVYELASNPGLKLENPFDLRNLRIINPTDVTSALQSLEEQSVNGRPSLCVIGTGGTISMVLKEGTKRPELDIDSLLDYSGRNLLGSFNRASLSFPELIDSSQMKMDYDADTVIAMSYMWKRMSDQAKKNFRGFVIAHGTDTMAQSATRIQMMLGPNIDFSVGITGSQQSIDNVFNDVGDNLGRSIATLDMLYAADRHTVFLYMGGSAGGALHPSGARKRSDTDINAFESQAIPPILDASNTARVQELQLPFVNEYKRLRHERLDPFQPVITRGYINSRLIEADMDISSSILAGEIETHGSEMVAVILRTYGSFTFDRQQVDAVMRAAKKAGILVFATNPFPVGKVDHEYADAQYIIEQGAIPLHMMPHAAAVKLKLAETIFGRDIGKIEEFMAGNNYVGEQPPTWTPRRTVGSKIRGMGQPNESLPETELNIIP